MNLDTMDLRRVSYAILLVNLICVFAAGGSEGKRPLKTSFSNANAWASLNIKEDTADELWIKCWNELLDAKETVKSVSLFLHNDIKAALFTKGSINKAMPVLPPEIQKALSDCLEKRNTREEDTSPSWFVKFFWYLFCWPNTQRRYLLGKPNHLSASGPGLAPAQAPSVVPWAYGPSPSAPFNPPPGNPPIPATSPPTLVAEPPSQLLPHPRVTESPPQIILQQMHQKIQKHIIIAVAAAVAVTFFLVGFFIFCLLKGSNNSRKIEPKDGKRDERPLLNLSLSDFSAGSSLGHSSNKDSNGNDKTPTVANSLSVVSDSSMTETPSSEAATTPLPPLKVPPGRVEAAPPVPPPPPPAPPIVKVGPRPPPPPTSARPPPLPRKSMLSQPSPLRPQNKSKSSYDGGDDLQNDSEAPKAKLKPFFWDKVLATPNHSMVWHEISTGSFQFNEETIQSLFGYTAADRNKAKKEFSNELGVQYIQIIDSKKSQNLSILLRALNVTTEEVCDALHEGNELPMELIQTLLRMAPTTEEELKLRLFNGDPSQLGPAERFLKVLVDIPFAFKRLESLLFTISLPEELSAIKESFATLEVACKELRNSRLFLKLLEAVLKTGNRMNDGTYRGGAQAFKLDTLLKLADVKGMDGKTTLLHFVVQEIIRSEGIRAVRATRENRSISSTRSDDSSDDPSTSESLERYRGLGLKLVSGLSGELENVRKAAIIDADGLTTTLSKLRRSLIKTREFLNVEMSSSVEEQSGFHRTLGAFVERAEVESTWLLEEEKRIMGMVQSTADYFHGNAGKHEGLRLFVIVRDFLTMLDKACKEVRNSVAKQVKNPRKDNPIVSSSPETCQPVSPEFRQRIFPAIVDRRKDNSSSDDEGPSP